MPYGPKCPNHQVLLEGLGKPPIPLKGEGTCPVSGCSFAYVIDGNDVKMVRDAQGNMQKVENWNVTGEE